MIIHKSLDWAEFNFEWGEWRPDSKDIANAIEEGKHTIVRIWLHRRQEFYNISVSISRNDPKLKKWIGKRLLRSK